MGSCSTLYGKDTLVVGQKNGFLYATSIEAGELFMGYSNKPWRSFRRVQLGNCCRWQSSIFHSNQLNGENVATGALWTDCHNKCIWRSFFSKWLSALGNWKSIECVAYGPPTVVGDLVFVARTGFHPNQTLTYDSTKDLIVIQNATGNILTAISLSSNFCGGIAVQGQSIMFGTGYSPSFSPQSSVSFEVMHVAV